jgi:GntR family transcriptional regulator, transcriptional repressor for pyruvate dehydrogenase complex
MSGQTTNVGNVGGFMSRTSLAALIESRIVGGDMTAGSKLPSERQLSEHYSVSRPIVREALRMLAERNLVEVMPGRGSYVRAPRSTDAAGYLDAHYRRSQATPRDLVEARTMLESTSASQAAERATPEELEAIEQALEGFAQSNGIVDQARYDLAFHLAIARAAHNPVIEAMFGSISSLTVELMLRSLSDPAVTQVSVPFHREIAEGIRARDPERARRAMTEHLAVASRLYGEDYDQSIERVARRELARLFAPGITLDDLFAAAGADGAGDTGRRWDDGRG